MVAVAGDADLTRRRAALAGLLALAACTTPAEKITSKLEKAGVPGHQARCMGDRLAQRLSYGQLRQLDAVVKDGNGERLTLTTLVRRLGDADPALVSEIVRTGVSCAI